VANKPAKHLFITLAALIALAGCLAFIFIKVGPWLAVADAFPARLDIIYTFGGENIRISYSRELMRRFPEAHWVISDYSHRYARMLQRQGFDMSRVTILDTCRSTISEVSGLAQWLKNQKSTPQADSGSVDTGDSGRPADLTSRPLHIGLVSNPMHMRRIRLIAEKAFRDPAIRLHCLPVPPERYGWSRRAIGHWWQVKGLRTWVGLETGKIVIFWALFSWSP
jgi:uncharacterized SAM-binding protein YcdF (DUF218 family)